MPHTINGIGTHYYGRANLSTVNGTCGHCGRLAQLSSYDTWECICFVFVPLVPVGHYRVLNDCAACRRHRRVKLKEFNASLATTIKPLRERLAASPRDASLHRGLVDALMRFDLWKEADEAARAGAASAPGDAELNRLAGEIAVYRGDLPAATPFLRKAATLKPADAKARLSLGRHLAKTGALDEAVRELEEARRLDASAWEVHYQLAQAYLKLERWGEALASFEQVLKQKPEFAKDPDILRATKTCKAALGYPLSPAEKKADRWWWPFGRKRDALPIGRRPISLRALGVVALVLGGGGLVVGAAVALWKQGHVPVYFDDGLRMPVTITVDGSAFPVAALAREKRALGPGSHGVVVTGPKGELERATIAIERLPLVDALLDGRFFVYDVAEARIYRRAKVWYGGSGNEPDEESVVAFQRFFAQPATDYVFEPPPASISMSSTLAESRSVFDVAGVDYTSFAVIRFGEGKADEAERALRKAIALEPCEPRARRNLVNLQGIVATGDKALDEARAWVRECPEAGVESHRAYQDVALGLGRREALLAEYGARLAGNPEVAANHYLLGRLLSDPTRAMSEHQAALRLDPRLVWARVALGYDLLALERAPEALAEFDAAMKDPAHDRAIPRVYALAAVGAGQAEAADKLIATLMLRDAQDAALRDARFLLLVARQDWKAAAVLAQPKSAAENASPPIFFRQAKLRRLQGDDAGLAALIEQWKANKDVAALSAAIRLERLVEDGRYREAAAFLDSGFDKNTGSAPDYHRVCVAAGLLMAGDVSGARALGARLAADAAKMDDTRRDAVLALLGALEGRLPAASAIETVRRDAFEALPFAYFALGSRAHASGDRAAARALFARSQATALDLDFPFEAARRLAAP